MADTNNILKDLKNNRVSPPEGLFAKIWYRIQKLKPSKNKGNPSEESRIAIPEINTTDVNAFSQLREFESAAESPPAFDLSMMNSTGNEKQPVKKPIPLFYKIAAAASIIGAALYFFSPFTKSENNKQSFVSKGTDQKGNQTSIPSDSSSFKDLSSQNIATSPPPATEYIKRDTSGFVQITDNLRGDVIYNDFYYTLTNFTYYESRKLLKDLKNDNRISIGKFSYINISDKMESFLKRMYKVNRKKKPTRKAKRMKKKLQSWKKTDDRFFAPDSGKNPLDIFDLSEIIFKK